MTNIDKLSSMIPLDQIEPGALAQIQTALDQPFVERIAIMPDCHQGYDLPIGAVALCRGVISPSYVGYDIGCGMTMIATSMSPEQAGLDSEDGRQRLMEKIVSAIPMGRGRQHEEPVQGFMEIQSEALPAGIQAHINSVGARQLGTLGSGNHFIEVGVTQNSNRVVVTVHSGSRNPGHAIAGWYMKQSPYLDVNSTLGQAYAADMNWAQKFALDSRWIMASVVVEQMGSTQLFSLDEINEHHNGAWDMGNDMWLHRKGATPAAFGQLGVIPLNARDGVVITKGMGNNNYLSSASHGAGRGLGRKAAERQIAPESFWSSVSDFTNNFDLGMIDESPEAYKDGAAVIAAQDHVVVMVVDRTRPLIVVKGN